MKKRRWIQFSVNSRLTWTAYLLQLVAFIKQWYTYTCDVVFLDIYIYIYIDHSIASFLARTNPANVRSVRLEWHIYIYICVCVCMYYKTNHQIIAPLASHHNKLILFFFNLNDLLPIPVICTFSNATIIMIRNIWIRGWNMFLNCQLPPLFRYPFLIVDTSLTPLWILLSINTNIGVFYIKY